MPEVHGQLFDRPVHGQVEFLKPARDLDRPAFVAEVAFDLAHDRRGRVGRELDAARGVEAIDRLDQTERSDLDQVLERLAAVGELDREIAHEIEIGNDQVVAQAVVRELVDAAGCGQLGEGLAGTPAIPALRVGRGGHALKRRRA